MNSMKAKMQIPKRQARIIAFSISRRCPGAVHLDTTSARPVTTETIRAINSNRRLGFSIDVNGLI